MSEYILNFHDLWYFKLCWSYMQFLKCLSVADIHTTRAQTIWNWNKQNIYLWMKDCILHLVSNKSLTIMYCRYLIFSLRFPVLFDAKIFCLLVNSFKEVEGLMVNLNKVAPVLWLMHWPLKGAMFAINDKKLSQKFFRYLAYRHYFLLWSRV